MTFHEKEMATTIHETALPPSYFIMICRLWYTWIGDGTTSLSERIRQLRQQRGLSQGALAQAVGCSRSFIAKLEAGQREDVSLSLAIALAKALQVSLEELAGLRAPLEAERIEDSLRPDHPILAVLVSALRERSISCVPARPVEVQANMWRTFCPVHGKPVYLRIAGTTLYVNAMCNCSRTQFLLTLSFSTRDLIAPAHLTVEDLAKHVGLDPTFLRSLGIQDRHGIIEIPYRDLFGNVVSIRYRFALDKKDAPRGRRFGWRSRDHEIPYGLDRLFDAQRKEYIIIVEEESNAWTLWYEDFPALGLPGLWKEDLLDSDMSEWIERVFVVEERDVYGAMFAWAVAKHIRAICPQLKLTFIRPPAPAKDLNAYYQQDPESFRTWLRNVVESS